LQGSQIGDQQSSQKNPKSDDCGELRFDRLTRLEQGLNGMSQLGRNNGALLICPLYVNPTLPPNMGSRLPLRAPAKLQ
jgi:hypothetical protein